MKQLTTNLKFSITVLSLLFTVILFSCKKEGSTSQTPVTEQEALTMTEENAEADAEFDDVTEIGLSASADAEVYTGSANNTNDEVISSVNDGGVGVRADVLIELAFKLGPCAKVTITPNDSTFPKTITIDYGTGCICRDGKFRKGVIVLHYTAPIRKPGAVLTITLDNYYVNRAHIEGKKIIKNLTEGSTHKYAVVVINGKVSWQGGRGFTYEGTKEVTQQSGMDTRTVRDDVYAIEGRSKVTYASGVTVNKNTESPLIKAVACNWISKGVLKIKINDRVLYINYGNGDCDNKATLKWAGGEKTITLP